MQLPRSLRHIPWPILFSIAVHLAIAVSLVIQTTVPPPKTLHVVHMHLMAAEHHAAPKAVAAAPAATPAPTPAPVAAVKPQPKPQPLAKAKPKPLPQPKPVPQPVKAPPPVLASRPLPTPAAKVAGLAVAAKAAPEPAAAPKPMLAAARPAAAAPAETSAVAAEAGEEGEGEDSVDGGDQSAEALLIHATVVKPEFTSEALFARLEGLFPMNVQIDASGRVLSAQLAKKVGYGMDNRILASIKNARFQPGRDEHGRPRGGWVKMKFKLEIPD